MHSCSKAYLLNNIYKYNVYRATLFIQGGLIRNKRSFIFVRRGRPAYMAVCLDS